MGRTATCGVIVAALLTGCGGDDGVERPAAQPSAPVVTTTTFDREAEEAAVIAAYLAEIDAFYLAANPPNPDHPALAETATGPELTDVRAFLATLQQHGTGLRKGEETANHPRVARLEGSAAVVTDCVTDADIQFDLGTGSIVNDDVSYGEVSARLVRAKDGWLVDRTTVEPRDAPCED